jgi:hypothetical protein
MTDLFKHFLRVLKALGEEDVDYILIGGFAVILYGLPRLTQDIDIFVKMTADNIDRLQKALYGIYQDESIHAITLEELNQYSVIRYGAPDGFYIDIMARIGEVATYEDLEYETMDVEGIAVFVATPGALFELKKDTLRTEDKRDAFFLSELIRKSEDSEDGN